MNKSLLIIFLIISCSCISKSQELYHVFFPNNQIGYASGFHTSHIYKTTDAGETWASQSPSLGTGEIGDLFFWSPDSGVALFSDVAKTTNGGLSWESYPTGNPYWLFAVDFLDSYSGIAVGVTGKIVETTDGGEEWNLVESGTDIALCDVEYVTPNLIVICGDDFSGGGIILRSTNGGSDWNSPSLPINGGFRSISFIDSNIGIATGDQGKIIRTTDGGEHWTEMTNPNTNFLFSCRQVSANTAFAVGELGNIIKSTDGQSWVPCVSPTENTLYDIFMFNESEGITVGNFTILKTTDSGINWYPKTFLMNIPNLVLPLNGSYDQPVDLWLSWENSFGAATYRVQVAIDSLFTSFVFNDSTIFGPEVYLSGELNISTKYYWRVKAKNSSLETEFSEVWSFTTGPATDIHDTENGIPTAFNLGQNYPNPFNPSTTITYEIPSTGFVSLKIYNVLGIEIETLINEEKSSGRYEVEFNGSNLASGIYFYRITTKDFSETRKMILMK